MASLFTKVELYLIANSKTWSAETDNIELQNDGSETTLKHGMFQELLNQQILK